MDAKTYLAQVLRWSNEAELGMVEAVAAGMGMAAPVLAGAALGQLRLGIAASIGSLMVGTVSAGATAKAQMHNLQAALAPAAAASMAAVLAAGHDGWTNAVVTLLAGAAATIGGYSRPLAVLAARFVLLLIITVNVAGAAEHRAAFLLLIAVGAAWTAGLSLLLRSLIGATARLHPSTNGIAPSVSTARQKRARWRRSLRHLWGWQYTLRLVLCLGIADALQWLWPEHHLYWVALTVALLCQRQLEVVPVKAVQRALGTGVGVLAAGLFLALRPPVCGLVIGIGLLAGARPLLRTRNYLAYSVVMTPLLVLMLDSAQPPGAGILVDRLAATLLGAGLVIAANFVFTRTLATPSS